MREKIYLDTSVFSAYYDKRAPERLALTRKSWQMIEKCQRFCSDLTIQELEAIEELDLREQLRGLTQGFEILPITSVVENLAQNYVKFGIVPRKYLKDALHVAVASVNELDVLLSWNFQHLVKRKTRLLVNLVNSMQGYKLLEIIAPPEL